MAVKKYTVTLTYHTIDTCTYTPYATTPEMAQEIAMQQFLDNHTDKCVKPKVTQTLEK